MIFGALEPKARAPVLAGPKRLIDRAVLIELLNLALNIDSNETQKIIRLNNAPMTAKRLGMYSG